MDINALIAREQAKPMTHKVVTLYADGTAKEHQTRGEAQANNWATGERRKIGRDMISRTTGRTVCVTDVYVVSL